MQALERLPQGSTGRGHNRRVKRVAHRQLGYKVVGSLEYFDSVRYRITRAADDGLVLAVHVGDHEITAECFENTFNFLEWSEDRGHAAVICHRHAGHLAATDADRLQRVLERQGASSYQGSVFAQAVSHR